MAPNFDALRAFEEYILLHWLHNKKERKKERKKESKDFFV